MTLARFRPAWESTARFQPAWEAAATVINATASGALDSISLTAPTGTAVGAVSAVAEGAVAEVSLTAPTGAALGIANVSAAGAVAPITLTAPTYFLVSRVVPDRPHFRSTQWAALVRQAEPGPSYYDTYSFTGRTFTKRDN